MFISTTNICYEVMKALYPQDVMLVSQLHYNYNTCYLSVSILSQAEAIEFVFAMKPTIGFS